MEFRKKILWLNSIILMKLLAVLAVLTSCKPRQNIDGTIDPVTLPTDAIVVVEPQNPDSITEDTITVIKIDTINPKYKPVEPICLYGVQPVIEFD